VGFTLPLKDLERLTPTPHPVPSRPAPVSRGFQRPDDVQPPDPPPLSFEFNDPQPFDGGYGPVGPQGPVAPTPSTGDPGLWDRITDLSHLNVDASQIANRSGAAFRLLNPASLLIGAREDRTQPLQDISAVSEPYVTGNPVVEELTRPANAIPFGKGMTTARAVTEAVGGRLAVEAAQPLVEKLPESWQGAADLGLNIAGQVATGAAYGRAGGALGMGIKNVGEEALDPLSQAKRDVLEAVRKEANIRKVGTAAREIAQSRGTQARGIRAAGEQIASGGATIDEAIQQTGKGMYLGGRYSGRQTYAAPLEMSDDTQRLIVGDLSDQLIRGDLTDWQYRGAIGAMQRLKDGVGLEPGQIPFIRRILGDEVANVVAGRPKGLEQEVMSAAKIAEERARLDAIGRRAAQDALKSTERQSVKAVEARLRALGADTDLPIPPRPSDETIRLAAMSPERLAGELKGRVIRARRIVGAYEDGIANAAKRDAKALLQSNKIIEAGIDFEAKTTAKAANQAANNYAALIKRQEAIRSSRVAQSAVTIEEGIGAEAQAMRGAVNQQASEAMQQMTGAARAARNKARDQMIDAFNAADAATIQGLRANFETLAAQETARAARFRTPGVLEGAESTVRQADALLNRLTQKFPDEATLFTRADEITERAAQALPRVEREATKAKVREMVRLWDDGNRAILDTMGDEAPGFVRAVSSQITGNVADSWLTAAMFRKTILSNALRSELDPKVASRVADALFNKEMIGHYKVADPSKLPAEVQEMVRQTRSLPYEQATGAVETLVARAKNSQFGLADMGVFGVNALNNIRRGGIQAFAGGINRGLSALHLPHVDTHLDNPVLSRKIVAALDGVHQGTTYGATVPDKGSLLQYGGKIGQAIDRQLNKAVTASNDFQFGTVLGTLRNADYEGNLVILKILGRDIKNPSIRANAAANANHLSGFANSALKRGRATVEGMALTSTSMTRARIAQIADLAKLITPKATPEQRIMAAMGIVSTVGYTLTVGKLLNDRIGVTDFIFDSSVPGFGTITTADGRTHDTIPQDSVERAFAKSIRAIIEADPEMAAKAWGNVLIGSSSVVARAPAAGFGVGYQPGRGYRYGDWGDDMTGGQKAASLLPIPPIATDIATQGLSPVGTTETFLGIGNYPASGRTLADAGLYGKVGTPEQQFEGIRPQAWQMLQDRAPEGLTGEIQGADSFYDWFEAKQQEYRALADQRFPNLTPAERERRAVEAVRRHPVYGAYLKARTHLTNEWVKTNPDVAREMDDDMADLPESERAFRPTKKQRAVIAEAGQ